MADIIHKTALLVLRQAADSTTSDTTTAETDTCDTGNNYDGRIGVRISAIFVILVGSFLGAWFPVFAARHRGMGVPEWAFFIAKYFGSGVILATAFIHLLAPANEALTNPCLTGPITEYSWVEGIVLMTIFVLFFVELMMMRYGSGHGHAHDHDSSEEDPESTPTSAMSHVHGPSTKSANVELAAGLRREASRSSRHSGPVVPHVPGLPGEDHFGHSRHHTDNEDVSPSWAEPSSEKQQSFDPESYAAQLTAIFIFEFGIVFHSVFIGLTLAVSGEEFPTLYAVLVFHQTFEGLALGSRLGSHPWPRAKIWTPYMLALGYAISTPIAIAIGLGVRQSYPPNSAKTLIINGVFDSISAGILIYTGLVELMAHEFMFSTYMQRASIKTVLAAFATMCFGAGIMALLGKWA